MKNYFLMTTKWQRGKKISIELLAKKLKVSADDLDSEFGLVQVDEQDNIYSYRISEEGLAKTNKKNKKDTNGPFADVKIEPFGPPK